MELLARLRAQARKDLKKIVFPEGDDPRVIAACTTLAREELAIPIRVDEALIAEGRERYAKVFFERRKHRADTASADRRARSRASKADATARRCWVAAAPGQRCVSRPRDRPRSRAPSRLSQRVGTAS